MPFCFSNRAVSNKGGWFLEKGKTSFPVKSRTSASIYSHSPNPILFQEKVGTTDSDILCSRWSVRTTDGGVLFCSHWSRVGTTDSGRYDRRRYTLLPLVAGIGWAVTIVSGSVRRTAVGTTDGGVLFCSHWSQVGTTDSDILCSRWSQVGVMDAFGKWVFRYLSAAPK